MTDGYQARVSKQPPREWESLRYLDARQILLDLRKIEKEYSLSQLKYEAASLRTRALRPYNEGRQAALFCYGMGQALGCHIEFAQFESQDFDVVTRYIAGETAVYCIVQLKELVPDFLNPLASLQTEVDKLDRYSDSRNLAVAFHLNRTFHVDPLALRLPNRYAGSLWLYGATDITQDNWILMGNLADKDPHWTRFKYPTE